MADWKFQVSIKGILHNEEKTIQEKGLMAAGRLKKLKSRVDKSKTLPDKFRKYASELLDEFIFEFESVEDVESFDYTLCNLYDLGDEEIPSKNKSSQSKTSKFCWVVTE